MLFTQSKARSLDRVQFMIALSTQRDVPFWQETCVAAHEEVGHSKPSLGKRILAGKLFLPSVMQCMIWFHTKYLVLPPRHEKLHPVQCSSILHRGTVSVCLSESRGSLHSSYCLLCCRRVPSKRHACGIHRLCRKSTKTRYTPELYADAPMIGNDIVRQGQGVVRRSTG